MENDLITIKIINKIELCRIIKITKSSYLLSICSSRHIIRKPKHTKYNIYILYDKTIDVYSNSMLNNKYIVYCNYCSKNHGYNKLGYNSYHCNSNYSPYKNYGINIIFKFNSIKECLLSNFKAYLVLYINSYYYILHLNILYKQLYQLHLLFDTYRVQPS